MTNQRAIQAWASAVLVAVVAACTSTGTEPTTIGSRPSEVVEPSVTPPLASSVALPTEERQTPEPPMPEPPAASIAVDGGDRILGELGTFEWQNGGSHAPWLDGSPIHVGGGELLTLTMAEPVPISSWSVRRQLPGSRDDFGSVGMAEGSEEPVTFPSPPAGAWSVNVTVRFTGTLGSAAYYWLVEVE